MVRHNLFGRSELDFRNVLYSLSLSRCLPCRLLFLLSLLDPRRFDLRLSPSEVLFRSRYTCRLCSCRRLFLSSRLRCCLSSGLLLLGFELRGVLGFVEGRFRAGRGVVQALFAATVDRQSRGKSRRPSRSLLHSLRPVTRTSTMGLPVAARAVSSGI